MNTNAAQRHRRKLLLANMLNDKPDDESEEHFLAVYSAKTQVSIRTAREYLKEIRLARVIEQEIPVV